MRAEQAGSGLVASHLSKVYVSVRGAEVRALSNINLSLRRSEFVAIVGPSGCGKSTLLNILAGLDTPSEGEVRLDGELINGPSPQRTMVFQQFALFPWMTVASNIGCGLRFTHAPRASRKDRIRDVLETVGLSKFANAYPRELSGGMKQRVAIARAYALEPEVLLMDEPFGALDAQTRLQLQLHLLDTWSIGQSTVVFVTHDVEEAVFLANRVIVMSRYPGEIFREFEIDIPYPRTRDLMAQPEFFELRTRVWQTVYTLAEAS